jgi:UDP-glucose 4-epimerase
MRALITGGAGFIGSHVVDGLVARGDEVTVIDNLSSGRRENLAEAEAAGVTLIEADLTDPAAVASAFDAADPETVLHLAAQIDVRVSVADPVFDLDVNVGGTLHLLEQARARDRCRIVFASTGGAIYGEGAGRELPLSEDAECLPDAPYGLSKQCAESYLALYARLYGVEVTSLRLGNVYGPRQDPHGEAGVVAIFCGALLEGRRPRVFGDGEQTRDYVYVADVAAAFLAACEAPPGGPYNIGTGAETSVLELGTRIAAACGVEFDPELAPPRTGEVQRIAIDPRRAADELGWKAEHDLDRGLAATVESFRS